MITLFFACYTTYAPEKISGTWMVSEVLFAKDGNNDLDTNSFQGKSFEFHFGESPAYATDDTIIRSETSIAYSEEDAADLWRICSSDRDNPYIYCVVPPLLIYQDEWLPEATSRLPDYQPETCFIALQAHDAYGYVVSATEIWFSEGFFINCSTPTETNPDQITTYQGSYNSHWERSIDQ